MKKEAVKKSKILIFKSKWRSHLAEGSHKNYFLRFDLKAKDGKHWRKIEIDLHAEQGIERLG